MHFAEWLYFFIIIGFPMLLLGIGFISGRLLEKRHYQSIIARETAPNQVMVFPCRTPPPMPRPPHTQLVCGSVVISADYFKRFIASLRMLVGGRLNTYESLIDRARREALLRMREDAQRHGAQAVFNVRIETASISGRAQQGGVSCLEVLAYGTAIIEAR